MKANKTTIKITEDEITDAKKEKVEIIEKLNGLNQQQQQIQQLVGQLNAQVIAKDGAITAMEKVLKLFKGEPIEDPIANPENNSPKQEKKKVEAK